MTISFPTLIQLLLDFCPFSQVSPTKYYIIIYKKVNELPFCLPLLLPYITFISSLLSNWFIGELKPLDTLWIDKRDRGSSYLMPLDGSIFFQWLPINKYKIWDYGNIVHSIQSYTFDMSNLEPCFLFFQHVWIS